MSRGFYYHTHNRKIRQSFKQICIRITCQAHCSHCAALNWRALSLTHLICKSVLYKVKILKAAFYRLMKRYNFSMRNYKGFLTYTIIEDKQNSIKLKNADEDSKAKRYLGLMIFLPCNTFCKLYKYYNRITK